MDKHIPRESDATIDALIEDIRVHVGNVNSIVCVGALDGHELSRIARCFPDARHLAVEGHRETYEQHLRSATWLETYNTVIARETGRGGFYTNPTLGNGGILPRSKKDVAQRCMTVSLDDFCWSVSLDHVDVLMIDVEGAAYEVLYGGPEILGTVKLVYAETEKFEVFLGQRLDVDVDELLDDHDLKRIRREAAGPQLNSVWVRR